VCFAAFALRAAPAASAAYTPVILVSIDTLRADHLSTYGYRKIATSNIDELVRGGTRFMNVECQIPLTLPSHTSLFTSTYPSENGVEENAQPVHAGTLTLAAVLRNHGYQTAAFIGSVFLEKQMGLDQGFDVYDSPFAFEAFSPLSGEMFLGSTSKSGFAARESRDGALVIAAASRWIASHRLQPSFVFLHLFDMHEPYSRPASAARQLGISRYDSQLLYVDRLIGVLRRSLEQDGLWERALVILLSDHGEGLGEHGEANHGYFIYQSTLRVPLLIHWPASASHYPPEVGLPAGLIDVAPTILDFLHISRPQSFHGHSLLTEKSGAPRSVYAESLHAHHSFGWASLRSIRVGRYKYIQAPRPELYDLENDPHERDNIASKDQRETLVLRTELKKFLERYSRRGSTQRLTSPQSDALLRSLGYLSGVSTEQRDDSGADPKDRLQEFKQYTLASEAAAEGRSDRAISILNAVIARDPHNLLAVRDIGAYSLDRRSYARARSALERFVAAAPDDYMGRLELGIADEHLGLYKDAELQLQRACRIAPRATQCTQELDVVRRKLRGAH
jgi:arylsulfatase A-like enzyme